MSMTRGDKANEAKVKEELERIASLGFAIKCLAGSGINESVIRVYCQEILMHCETIEELKKNG